MLHLHIFAATLPRSVIRGQTTHAANAEAEQRHVRTTLLCRSDKLWLVRPKLWPVRQKLLPVRQKLWPVRQKLDPGHKLGIGISRASPGAMTIKDSRPAVRATFRNWGLCTTARAPCFIFPIKLLARRPFILYQSCTCLSTFGVVARGVVSL